MSQQQSEPVLEGALHRLRSAMARVQAEAEIMVLDGAAAGELLEATRAALARLTEAEDAVEVVRRDHVAGGLVVLEDDERLGIVLARRLERSGHSVCLAVTVRSAIVFASRQRILLADLTALESATDTEAQLVAELRPVVMTGATYADAVSRAERFRARAVLSKPFEVDTLANL